MSRTITHRNITLAAGILVAALVSLVLWFNDPTTPAADIQLSNFSSPINNNTTKAAGDIIVKMISLCWN